MSQALFDNEKNSSVINSLTHDNNRLSSKQLRLSSNIVHRKSDVHFSMSQYSKRSSSCPLSTRLFVYYEIY